MSRRDWLVIGVIVLLAVGVAGLLSNKLRSGLQPVQTNTESPAPAAKSEPELAAETVLEGLSNVWDAGFLPDGTTLFTERSGTISKVADGKKVQIHEISDIFDRGEGGLMGLAIDPEFASNRFIYACYDATNDIRVSRWRVNADVTALSDQVNIITGMPINKTIFPGRHSGCRPRFDAQEHLWIGTGDVAIGTNPQDPKSLGGKILRIDRNGKAVAGNLKDPFDPRIFSYGHRNIQGIVMGVKGGVKCDPDYLGFSVEHGPGKDDEVNQIIAGNAGWDPVPGYNENVPMTNIQKFPDARMPIWSSGGSAIAPSGATMIKGNKWGTYDNTLALAVLKDKHVRILILDDNCGQSVTKEIELFKDDFGRIRSAVMGPYDTLYLTTDNGNGDDKIIKITPQ